MRSALVGFKYDTKWKGRPLEHLFVGRSSAASIQRPELEGETSRSVPVSSRSGKIVTYGAKQIKPGSVGCPDDLLVGGNRPVARLRW